VLVDKGGDVTAIWASFAAQGREGPRAFFAGIPAGLARDIVAPLREGRPVAWRSIGAELRPISLADGRGRGLSEQAARTLEEHDSSQRRVLSVRLLAADVAAADVLQEGDLILAIDGEPVTRVREVEQAVQQAERVRLRLLRDGAELEVDVPTQTLSGRGTDRAVLWAGALLQRPHRAIAAQRGLPREGVYVAWYAWGSPAHRYGLGATRRIEAVDGKPTPDLDALLDAVADKGDRAPVRLRTVDLEGKPSVITLKLDQRYWPVTELHRNGGRWQRTTP
jgi:S1-C subfamily serine protease